MNREFTPFNYEIEKHSDFTFETKVGEFSGKEFEKQNPGLKIVKEVKLDDLAKKGVGIENFKQSRDLLLDEKFGFGEYLPKTEFVVGKNEHEESCLFILQEKSNGLHLDKASNEIIEHFMDFSYTFGKYFCKDDIDLKSDARGQKYMKILAQLDDLIDKSFLMWKQTRKMKDLPRGINEDFIYDTQYHRVQKGEGLMPEIFNLKNTMVEGLNSDDPAKISFVDNHSLIIVDQDSIEWGYVHETMPESFGALMNLFQYLGGKSKSVKTYEKILSSFNR